MICKECLKEIWEGEAYYQKPLILAELGPGQEVTYEHVECPGSRQGRRRKFHYRKTEEWVEIPVKQPPTKSGAGKKGGQ